MCPLQENPVYHVLDTLRPQWESCNGTWEVRKLSPFIGLLFYFIVFKNFEIMLTFVPTAGEPHVPRAGIPAPKPRPPAVGVLHQRLGGVQTSNI